MKPKVAEDPGRAHSVRRGRPSDRRIARIVCDAPIHRARDGLEVRPAVDGESEDVDRETVLWAEFVSV